MKCNRDVQGVAGIKLVYWPTTCWQGIMHSGCGSGGLEEGQGLTVPPGIHAAAAAWAGCAAAVRFRPMDCTAVPAAAGAGGADGYSSSGGRNTQGVSASGRSGSRLFRTMQGSEGGAAGE